MVDIEISDLDPELKERAEIELKQLFAKFKSLKVVLTKDFDNTVMEYLRRRGVTIPYSSTRLVSL